MAIHSMNYEYCWQFDFNCKIEQICHAHIHKLAKPVAYSTQT